MNVVIKVDGMTCNHCKMAVENAANSIDSVESAVVNLDAKELSFSYNGSEEEITKSVKSAVTSAGYTPL